MLIFGKELVLFPLLNKRHFVLLQNILHREFKEWVNFEKINVIFQHWSIIKLKRDGISIEKKKKKVYVGKKKKEKKIFFF